MDQHRDSLRDRSSRRAGGMNFQSQRAHRKEIISAAMVGGSNVSFLQTCASFPSLVLLTLFIFLSYRLAILSIHQPMMPPLATICDKIVTHYVLLLVFLVFSLFSPLPPLPFDSVTSLSLYLIHSVFSASFFFFFISCGRSYAHFCVWQLNCHVFIIISIHYHVSRY